MREIEVSHQNVRLNSKHAKSYYNRGVIYQNLGYKEAAIWDYSEAIRLNHLYAEAYQNRGLTRAYLGDKRGAVEDLREAAKLFFAEGDITSYQMAKDLSIKFHELSSVTEIKTPTEAIESLFS